MWGQVVRSVMTTKYTRIDDEETTGIPEGDPWDKDEAEDDLIVEEPLWITTCYWVPKHLRNKELNSIWAPTEKANVTECSDHEENTISE